MPETTAKEFLEASDNASDYADKLITDNEDLFREDIDNLILDDAKRDDELWQTFGTSESVLSDYDGVEREERDLDWAEGMAGMTAASMTQVFLDEREDTIIKPVAYREMVVGALVVAPAVLRMAGKRTVDVVAPETYQALQSKYLKDLAFLDDLSNTELYNVLVEAGAMRPPDKLIMDQMGYVSRMTGYRPGSPQFAEEVANLVDLNARSNIRSMNRRAVQRIYTDREVGGDLSRLMVWILERGPHNCSYCLDRAGDVRTYGDWIDAGLPGAEVCKGGDRCHCHLAAL
jgi:hypothetical protein